MDINKDHTYQGPLPFKKGFQKTLEKLSVSENPSDSGSATSLILFCKEAMLELEPETKTAQEAVNNVLSQLDQIEQKAQKLTPKPVLEKSAQKEAALIADCKKNMLEVKLEDPNSQKAVNDVVFMLDRLDKEKKELTLTPEGSLKKAMEEEAEALAKTPSIDSLLGKKVEEKKQVLPMVDMDLSKEPLDIIEQSERKILDIKAPDAASRKSLESAQLDLGRLKQGYLHPSKKPVFETKKEVLDLILSCKKNVLDLPIQQNDKIKEIIDKAALSLDRLQQGFATQEEIKEEPKKFLEEAEGASSPDELLLLISKCRKLVLGLKKSGGDEDQIKKLLKTLSKLKGMLIILFRRERKKLIEMHLAKLREEDEVLAKKAEKQLELLRKFYINQPIMKPGG